MSWPCRCRRSVCQARQNVRFKPDTYATPRKCRACGKGLLRVDHYRHRVELHNPKRTCFPDRSGCRGYSFPHRIGSKWCDANPKLTVEELQQRDGWS